MLVFQNVNAFGSHGTAAIVRNVTDCLNDIRLTRVSIEMKSGVDPAVVTSEGDMGFLFRNVELLYNLEKHIDVIMYT